MFLQRPKQFSFWVARHLKLLCKLKHRSEREKKFATFFKQNFFLHIHTFYYLSFSYRTVRGCFVCFALSILGFFLPKDIALPNSPLCLLILTFRKFYIQLRLLLLYYVVMCNKVCFFCWQFFVYTSLLFARFSPRLF